MKIVFLVHYFPPVNSAGAKRVEALSKYMAAAGHDVTVVTTSKSSADGALTEQLPAGVEVLELGGWGRLRPSVDDGRKYEPLHSNGPTWRRRLKNGIFWVGGQIPDPRLPFAFSMLSPWLDESVKRRLRGADVVVGSTPPWPMLLAAIIVKWRFGRKCVLDYRDHFSECHEMPGNLVAKKAERLIDRALVAAADEIVVISDPMATYYRSLGGNVTTILNGFDQELMDAARHRAQVALSDNVVVSHMGGISPGRIPYRILDGLRILKSSDPRKFARFSFRFYGNAALLARVLEERYPELLEIFQFLPSLSYAEALTRMIESDYLLFSETSSKQSLSAAGILPTKLFEYIGAGRPVLADISPDTLAGQMLLRFSPASVVGDHPDAFVRAFNDEAFWNRTADVTSIRPHPLSRAAQALAYAKLVEPKTSS